MEPKALELVHLFDKLKSVRAFVFDVDGVFTNNEILITEAGELLRSMNLRDGLAVKRAVRAGFILGVITGGRSEGVKKRFEGLGVTEYYSGVQEDEKWAVLAAFMQRNGLQASDICYMGDDLPDLPVLRKVGVATCPADAIPEVLDTVDYVSPVPGGRGCVRDIIEKTMKLQEKWEY